MGLALGAVAIVDGPLVAMRACSSEPEPVNTIVPSDARWMKITLGDNIYFLPYWES